MRKNNKWTGGKVALHLPPPPPEYHGAMGCLLLEVTWDEELGPEVYLVILHLYNYPARSQDAFHAVMPCSGDGLTSSGTGWNPSVGLRGQ